MTERVARARILPGKRKLQSATASSSRKVQAGASGTALAAAEEKREEGMEFDGEYTYETKEEEGDEDEDEDEEDEDESAEFDPVAAVLAQLGFEEYLPAFQREKILLEQLPELDDIKPNEIIRMMTHVKCYVIKSDKLKCCILKGFNYFSPMPPDVDSRGRFMNSGALVLQWQNDSNQKCKSTPSVFNAQKTRSCSGLGAHQQI